MNPMDPLALINSSGSTGKPKYMVRSHLAVVATKQTAVDSYGLN
jgi:acyl-coenzyme A synthetase/AMP-(fatty) acid ligase